MTDPAPRLKPIDLEALRSQGVPAAVLAEAGEPPTWPPLIGRLRADPDRPLDLMRALAWGMDDPERLWWTCLAGRLEETASGRQGRSEALVLSERWLREKDDSVRYQAFERSREESALGPAAMVGLAAFVCGPSLAKPDQPAEPPPPNLPFETTLGALVAIAASPFLGPDGFHHIAGIGLDIAAGGDGREAARNALTAIQAPHAEAPAPGKQAPT